MFMALVVHLHILFIRFPCKQDISEFAEVGIILLLRAGEPHQLARIAYRKIDSKENVGHIAYRLFKIRHFTNPNK